MIFYKYSDFSVYALESIRSGKVFFSTREKLNDPFDCLPQIVVDVSEAELDEFLIIYGAEREQLHMISDDQKYSLVEHSQVSILKRTGVYCVTSNPADELMWAHYGNNHEGIVLGWKLHEKIPDTHNVKSGMPYEIRYTGRGQLLVSDLLLMSKSSNAGSDRVANSPLQLAIRRVITSMFLCKNPVWVYENEIRFLNLESSGLSNLGAELVSITFGHRFPDGMRPLVESLLDDSVKLFEISLSSSSLEREPINP